MPAADEYRAKATEFANRARREPDLSLRQQYEMLAKSYLRLAEQAEQNSRADLVYESPDPRAARPAEQAQQQQQQQQIQPKEPKS
jgi:hypothetical protein